MVYDISAVSYSWDAMCYSTSDQMVRKASDPSGQLDGELGSQI